MWRRKQKVYKDPRLHFVNEEGKYVTEYLPSENWKVIYWLRDQYIFLRNRLGWDIYYYHVRHSNEPYYRKVTDIEFLNHVINEHDQQPDNGVEQRHYHWLWLKYGPEMKFVIHELGKDADKDIQGDELPTAHQYAYAYVERWYRQSEPETKALYHGLKWPDYLETSRMILERKQHQDNEYFKEHGLDPETGRKLPKTKTKKQPKAKENA